MAMQLQKTTEDAIAIFLAGVDAVRADRLVESRVQFSESAIHIEETDGRRSWNLNASGRLIVIGAGKATYGMLQGLSNSLASLPTNIPVVGHINVPEANYEEINKLLPRFRSATVLQARPQGSNEPTELAVRGTRKIIELCESARKEDTVIFLLSGGASALLTSPIDGVTLNEKVQTTRVLSHCGATIEELNCVRRSLSTVKAGRLADRCNSGQLITLVISDVLGDSLSTIGSGPTWNSDRSSASQSLKVLEKYDPRRVSIPAAIYETLNRLDKEPSESRSMNGFSSRFTSKASAKASNHSHIILANNATAVDAAGVEAVRLGYSYWMESARQSEGSASQVGERLARQCIGLKEQPQISCIISGGEPTVSLPAPEVRGIGGRNQQLVLSALLEFQRLGLSDADWQRITLLSGGTDGEDGPTTAAGAWCDANTVQRMIDKNLSAEQHLARCNAYRFFDEVDSLLETGPTHTNVCDLRVAIYSQ